MTTVDEMTYQELIMLVLKKKGIQISLDGTGMAFVATNENGERIATANANPKVTIYDVLNRYLVAKEM